MSDIIPAARADASGAAVKPWFGPPRPERHLAPTSSEDRQGADSLRPQSRRHPSFYLRRLPQSAHDVATVAAVTVAFDAAGGEPLPPAAEREERAATSDPDGRRATCPVRALRRRCSSPCTATVPVSKIAPEPVATTHALSSQTSITGDVRTVTLRGWFSRRAGRPARCPTAMPADGVDWHGDTVTSHGTLVTDDTHSRKVATWTASLKNSSSPPFVHWTARSPLLPLGRRFVTTWFGRAEHRPWTG